MQYVAPWLPLIALVVLFACGGAWRKTAWWLAGAAVLVLVVTFGIGYTANPNDRPCETDLCTEDIAFLLGLAAEIALGALAVVLAVAAVIARGVRETR